MFTGTEVLCIAIIVFIFGGLLGAIIGEPVGRYKERARQKWDFNPYLVHPPAPTPMFDARRSIAPVGRDRRARRQQWN